MKPTSLTLSALIFGLVLTPQFAGAAEPVSTETPKNPIQASEACHPLSVYLGTDAGKGAYGYQITPSLGVAANCSFHSQDGKWYGQADASVEGTYFGLLLNTRPFNHLQGVRGQLGGTAGYRLLPNESLSPVLEAGARVRGRAITEPGVPFSDANQVNFMDGVGNLTHSEEARIGGGVSLLMSTNQALKLVLSYQEAHRGEEVVTHEAEFHEGKVELQYDWKNHIHAKLAGSYGFAGEKPNPPLGTSQETRWAFGGGLKVDIGKHFYWDLEAGASRDSHLVKASAASFDTQGPVAVDLSTHFGYNPITVSE